MMSQTRGYFARRFAQWIDARLPEPGEQTTLNRRRIYILPTRQGLIFFITLLTILLGAINYENNMGYLLAFLVASFGFLAMVHTHQNLNHLTVRAAATHPVFAGQEALFPIDIESSQKCGHINLAFEAEAGKPVDASLMDAHQTQMLKLPLTTRQRGIQQLPRFRVSTEFPLGLFHAWSWVKLDSQCLVYPHPAEHPPTSRGGGNLSGHASSNETGFDDFAGIREYRPGDSRSHLAWKAIARTGELQTRYFHADASQQLLISWHDLDDTLALETRLSILCRQVLDADRLGLNYALELPHSRTGFSSGQHHRHECLKRLALF